MREIVEHALKIWGLDEADWQLVAARENHVYRVDHAGRAFALRLHRAGYRSDAELRSELEWIGAVARGGLHVPTPIHAPQGDLLHVINDIQVDLLEWLSGAPMGKTGAPLTSKDRSGLFWRLGAEMAKLHQASDNWQPPKGFTRCCWDRDGLLGETPLWGRFWDNPTLSDADRGLFLRARDTAQAQLQRLEADLDYGLIHADLVRENVMVDGDKLQLIDFDDAGFGFRLFDLATTLIKNRDEPDYPALRDALIAGYRTVRALDTDALDLFMLLRALSYVGWIMPRMNEVGSKMRNARFVTTARALAEAMV